MSQKRKIEEYQDPDYQQFNEIKKRKILPLTEGDKLEKVQLIVKREFQKELSDKEQEINKIESRITQAKQLLHRVRYAIVANFYKKKGLELTDDEVKQTENNQNDLQNIGTDQRAIHPSLKKLLGKQPIDYDEILRMRPMRQAAKTAKTSISERLKKKKDAKRKPSTEIGDRVINESEDKSCMDRLKVPRYVEPIQKIKKIPQLNSSRGRNQIKHLIVVGNTSKYIGDEKSIDGVTHKWLVYVKTKTEIPIEEIVTKVRFFLHPSYKPNDVVDVQSSPFQLSRRGWGEFPIRVKLYFNNKAQQKPLQLIHTLVLDRKHTGQQTMGAETIVEMYLADTTDNSHSTVMKINDNLQMDTTTTTTTATTETQENQEEIRTNMNEYLLENGLTNFDITNSNLLDGSAFTFDNDFFSINPNIANKLNNLGFNINDYINENIIEEVVIEDHNQNGNLNDFIIKDVKTEKLDHNKLENNKILTNNISSTKEIEKQNIMKNIKQENIEKTVTNGITLNGITKDISKSMSSSLLLSSSAQSLKTTPTKHVNKPRLLNCLPATTTSTTTLPIIKTGTETILPKENSTPIVKNLKRHFNIVPKLQKISTSTSAATFERILLSKNQMIKKNGQIYIVDPTQKQKQQQKQKGKQMSLLKPKSLLKTMNNKDLISTKNNHNYLTKSNFEHTDHDYAKKIIYHKQQQMNNSDKNLTVNRVNQLTDSVTIPNNIKIIYTNKLEQKTNINNTNTNNNLSTKLIETKSIFPLKNKRSMVKKTIINYRKILETIFLKIDFLNVRNGVEYLLKKLPLINSLANDQSYRTNFPFIVETNEQFNKITKSKQICYEWFRAKLINRMIKLHPIFKKNDLWTTKEILLYARKFAYIPLIKLNQKNSNKINNENIKEIVENEIKREKLNNITTTFNHDIYEWTNDIIINKMNDITKIDDIIDVENDDEHNDDNGKYNFHNRVKQKNVVTEINNKSKLQIWIPLPSSIEKEGQFIAELTEDIGIRLKPEEIISDVFYPAAQNILANVLQSFTENLIRLAYGSKSSSNEQPIQPADIKNAILSRPEFDFLTNKHMGVPILKDDYQEQ